MLGSEFDRMDSCMGGGTKHTSDAKKGAPFDLLAAVAELSSAGGSDHVARAAAFCEQTHEVSFQADASTHPVVGRPVRLVVDEIPLVISEGAVIGRVDGALASAMRGCLALGYEMTGAITIFDDVLGRGVIAVGGSRRQVA
jgi:hypothetical protein